MRRFNALLIAAGLAAAPSSAAAAPSHDPWSTAHVERFEWTSKGRLGVMVMNLTPELRKHFGVAEDRGVLVAHVAPGTPAATAGIKVGDVIVEVRGKSIAGPADVLSAIADVDKGHDVTIQLVRGGKPQALSTTLSNDPLPSVFHSKWPISRWWRDLVKPLAPRDQTPEENWFRDFLRLAPPTKPTAATLRS